MLQNERLEGFMNDEVPSYKPQRNHR